MILSIYKSARILFLDKRNDPEGLEAPEHEVGAETWQYSVH